MKPYNYQHLPTDLSNLVRDHEALYFAASPLHLFPSRAKLRQRAEELKAGSGMDWVIGETVDRLCILFDAMEGAPHG